MISEMKRENDHYFEFKYSTIEGIYGYKVAFKAMN